MSATSQHPQRDNLFKQALEQPFTFDASVSQVFEDMIRRSVPGYALTLQMIAVIAGLYGQKGSNLYDLGCSLGASTLALQHGIQAEQCAIIGVDNSKPMFKQCQHNIAASTSQVPIHLILDGIENIVVENASVVVLNFTLQFIAPNKRQALLENIYNGMRDGAVLVLSEKVCFADTNEQQQNIQLHESFKKAQGYSDLEISRKRQSLENVLLPESVATHHAHLMDAGFTQSQTWFQCFNFASMLAYKK